MKNPTSTALLALLLLLILRALPAAAASTVHRNGDTVAITGVVTDPQGQPLADVRVLLEATRSTFNILRFERTPKDVRRLSATTNARGEYSLEWPWDDYYNVFELVVAVPVRKAEGERLEVLDRTDVTQRLSGSATVVAALVVENAAYLRQLRAFVGDVQSADERRVYGELGKPDEIKTVRYPDRTEVSWWYFEKGKVYRFADGKLEQVVPFEPVKAF